MTDFQFDQKIKEKLQGYECEIADGMWEGIAADMSARSHHKLVLRVAFRVVAAAACVAVGLFLFCNSQSISSLNTPSISISESIPQVIYSNEISQNVPSIAEQIKALGPAVAYVQPEELPSEYLQSIPAQEETVNQADVQKQPSSADVSKSSDKRAVVSLFDDADLFAEETPSNRTHTHLSISTNVFGVASQDGFVYKMAPSYSASLDDLKSSLVIEEMSESVYSIPLSFGVQMRFPIVGRLSLGAGIDYTYLQRSFSTLVNKEKFDNSSSQLHYIGLSASAFYDFVRSGNFAFYGRVGGAVDKCVYSRFVYGQYSMNLEAQGVQWAANAGLGIEYNIYKQTSVFLDPSVSYYFDCNQPKSIRTEQPLMFSLEAGVRFSL